MDILQVFREYDIRGLVGTEITESFVDTLGQVAGEYFLENGRKTVVIGADNRLSSPWIKERLCDSVVKTGCNVIDIGTVTSPLFYYSLKLYNIDGGLMITASHNPSEYNGFKVALGQGTIYGKEIAALGRRVKARIEEGLKAPSAVPGTLETRSPGPDYIKMLTDKIKLGPRKLKVALDCANGTASLFAVEFLKGLGCEVLPIYCESDGRFPNHHPDPVNSKNLVDLKRLVEEQNCDLGVGYDGDGDRLGIVDEKGNIIWGDQMMIIFWRELLKKYPGADVIIEVKCSQALVDEVKRLGGKPMFYRTGHSLIKAKMREIGAVFTGEMSGHMFFADEYYGFDDAFYATGRLLRILSNSQETLSQMLADAPKYYSTAETRVPCDDAAKFGVVDKLKNEFAANYEVIDVDGVRVLFEDGWGLARCSNTQPVIVARCEGKTPEALERISSTMRSAMLAHPEVGDFHWEY